MIITKTPVRISLLGGSTDFPAVSKKIGGLVVGGTIDKYSYISTRFLPPYHDFRTRLVYKEIEEVNFVEQIKHKAIRAVIERFSLQNRGLEVLHAADLPSKSGTGSSSTFVVGLINAIASLVGQRFLPHQLAAEATRIEQDVLKEVVGCQDQAWASFGGLNAIRFQKNGEISVEPLVLTSEHVAELESHLMLFFTKISRTSSDIAKSYEFNDRDQHAMKQFAENGINAIYSKDWAHLGTLIDQSWRLKASLSSSVTSDEINKLYAAARLAGAMGGKITGAGGGGCMLVVVKQESRGDVLQSLTKMGCVHIPFKFGESGSTVIFSSKESH